jgi:hypothetical protein
VKVKILSGTVHLLRSCQCEHKIDVVIESLDKRQTEIALSIHDRVCDKQLEVVYLRGERFANVSICADSSGYGDVLITRAGGKVIGHYWLKAGEHVKL